MNKGILAASVAAVLAAGAIGGSFYADKKIKAMYDADGILAQADKRVALSNSEVDMGLTGGKGKWTANYIPDLCHPDMRFTLRGEDEIKRGLSGYTILSKIYFVPENGQEIFVGDAQSTIGWGGGLDVKFTVPAGSHDFEQKLQLTWGQAEMKVAMSPKDYQGQKRYFVDSYEAKIPEISSHGDNSFQFQLKNLNYRGDAPFQAGLIKNGQEEADLEMLSVQISGFQAALGGLKSRSDLNAGSDKVSADSKLEAESLQISGKNYQNIRINSAVKDLDKAVLQQFSDLLVRQSQSCVEPRELELAARQIVMAATQKGINLESKGNQVELDGSKLTFDGSLNLPAGDYTEQQLMQQIAQLLKYQLQIVADKAFLQKSGLLQQNGQVISDEDLQQMAQQLPPPLKLDVQADKVTLSASNP